MEEAERHWGQFLTTRKTLIDGSASSNTDPFEMEAMVELAGAVSFSW